MAYCDHEYGSPSGRPRVSDPATYHLGTPQIQRPAVAQWHPHLRGLVTAIHGTSGLGRLDYLRAYADGGPSRHQRPHTGCSDAVSLAAHRRLP